MSRRLVLVALLAVVSGSAAAEWVKVTGDEVVVFYADPATIRRAGNMVTMWELEDLKTVQVIGNKRYMSTKNQHEYDCKEERTRILFTSGYSGNMGRGDQVFRISDPFNWEPVAPETMATIIWDFACGKR